MIKLLGYVLTLTIIIAFIQSCTSNDNAPQNIDAISAGAVIKSVHINNAWSAPTTLIETTTTKLYGGSTINLMTDADNGFFAAWEIPAKPAQFAMRPAIGTPWEITGPDIADFNTVFSPNLYSSPQSTSLFATWYSQDHGLGTHYVSRYTLDRGWTTPLAFADTKTERWGYQSKVIAGANAEAVLFWQTYAENGTVELHARRFNTNGDLSLMDTLTFGQPGRLSTGIISTKNLTQLNGWITAAGDVELYWVEVKETQPAQLWHSTYSFEGIRSATWSSPQKIANGQLPQSDVNYFDHFDVIPSGDDNVLIVFRSYGMGLALRSLESKAGIWGELTAVIPDSTNLMMRSRIAHNAQGQTVLTWTEQVRANANDSTSEFRVFATQHNTETGWTSPVQINRSSPRNVLIWGAEDEAKVSINATGQIAVTWINPLDETRNLYANYYDPATGWQGEELAVTSTLPSNESNGFYLSFNIALSNGGDISLLWQETEPSTDGTTTVQRVQSADHVGTGNGVANVIKSPQLASTPAVTDWFGPRTRRITPQRVIPTPLMPQQHINQILATANPRPIRLSSAWDEPTEIEVVTSPITDNRSADTLHLIVNQQDEATIYFGAEAKSATNANTVVSYVWSGDVLSGEWRSESPFSSLADPSRIFLNDLEVDPLTSDFYLVGGIMCPNESGCADLYVSRKPVGGTWETPVSLGKNARSLIDLIVSSTNIGAVWAASRDALYNLELAYAEYHQDTGWSTPDLFSPTLKANAIRPLNHGYLTWHTAVLGESGVVSLITTITDVVANQKNSASFLIQRHPVNGWVKTAAPAQTNLWVDNTYISATGADDSVHVMVNQPFTPIEIREASYPFSNGSWGSPHDVTAPRKGDVQNDRMSYRMGPATVSNRQGVVLIAWNEQIGRTPITRQVRINRYDPSMGWGQPIDIGLAMPGDKDRSLPIMEDRDIVESLRVSLNESGQGAVAWADISGEQQALNIVHLDTTLTSINHEIVRVLDLNQARFDAIDLHLDNQGRAILVWDELSTGPTEITHRIMTTTHHPAGTISPTPIIPPEIPEPTLPVLPALPKPSPNWSDAEIAWAFPNITDYQYLMQRPMITTVGDNPSIAIQVDRQFDWANNRFTASNHVLVSSNTPGEWKAPNPFGNHLPTVMAQVQLTSDANTNTVFALWSSQQQLYLNHRINNGTWESPQLIANNAETSHLLSNAPGQVVVVWQPIDDSVTVLVSEISVDATGAINLTTGDPSTKAAATLASDPAFNHQGILAILRAVPAATNQEYVVTQYEIGSGWQAWPDQTLNANGFNPMSLQLAITSNSQVVALAQSDSLRTLHSAFLQSDGTWTNWTAIQPSSDTPVALTGQYRMGTSTSGHLHVMWVEEIIDDKGEPINNVMFSSFDATGLATGNPWQAPTLITQIRHPNYYETPQLLVSRDGAAAIVWEQTATMQIDGKPTEVNSILVKKYAPDTGWNPDPDIAATFPLLFLDQPTSVSTYLSESNQLFIAWKTLTPPAILITRGQL